MAAGLAPATVWAWTGGTALAGAAFTALGLAYARHRQLVDLPGRRRSHAAATPRGGGVGPVLAWVGVLLIGPALASLPLPHAGALALATLLVAVIGSWDDHRPLPAWPRLLVHAVAATLLVAAILGLPSDAPAVLAACVLVLLLTGTVNAWNFMDGIDGLAAVESMFVAVALSAIAAAALQAGTMLLCLTFAAAVAGFLPFNTPRARIFLGDVGSGALGIAVAGLLLLCWALDVVPAAVAMLLPSAFLIDAGMTLATRIASGRQWYTAHREHLYQWLVRRRLSHARVVALYLLWNLLVVTPLSLAVLWHRIPPAVALVAAYGGGALLWMAARRMLLRRVRRYGASA